MIRPLRSRHRWLTSALAVAVPAIFLAALAARPPEPAVDRLPGELDPAPVAEAGEPAASWQALWPGLPLTTELHAAGPGRHRLALTPRQPIAAPDLLLYWTPGGEPDGDRLPEDARLIGSFDGVQGGSYPSPGAGTLHLYSLGHQRLLGRARLEPPGGAPATEPDDGA